MEKRFLLNGREFRCETFVRIRVVLLFDNGRSDRPNEAFEYETYEQEMSIYVPSRVALVLGIHLIK